MSEGKRQRMSHRIILPLIFVLILANIPPSLLPTSAQEPEFPDALVGTWEGTGIQTDADGNPDGEWTITLTLTGGPVGTVVGMVNYPDLGCSGELIYLGLDAPDAQGITLSEDITVGEELCVDGGTFALSLDPSTSLYFYWESPDSQSTASGTLPQVGDTAPDETGTGNLSLSSRTCFGDEGEPVTADYAVIYPDSGAFELPGGCKGPRTGYNFTITGADGSITAAVTDENGMLELDLAPGDYTITEDVSGVSTTVTVASDSWVGVGLMYWAPPDSPIDVTLSDGGGSETENWQQVTWEGLSISYPPAQTFYPNEDAEPVAGESTSAVLQPDDCAGTGMDCEILEFRLITNEGGLSAEEWADQNKRIPADARNFREVIIAGQTGIAFETGDPNSYPGESSFNAVPVGADLLEINGVGYQDVVEQIVASITVSAFTGEQLTQYGEAVDVTYALTVTGTPPEDATFFVQASPSEPIKLMGGSSQLVDPDGDGVYTAPFSHFSDLEYRISIVQGTGSYTSGTIGGTWPLDPITVIHDFGVMTISEPTTLTASVSFDTSSGEALLPVEFGGTWTGTVQQYENAEQGAIEETYPVELSLTAGAVGPVVGTISYPTLGCSGELTWLDMTSDSITLGETITSDDTSDGGSCVDGASIVLRFVDDQALAWEWFWPDGTQGAEAELLKVSIGTVCPRPNADIPDKLVELFRQAYDQADYEIGAAAAPALGLSGCVNRWGGLWSQAFINDDGLITALVHDPVSEEVYRLHGEILAQYAAIGGPSGPLGAPTGDTYRFQVGETPGAGARSDFANGYLSFHPNRGVDIYPVQNDPLIINLAHTLLADQPEMQNIANALASVGYRFEELGPTTPGHYTQAKFFPSERSVTYDLQMRGEPSHTFAAIMAHEGQHALDRQARGVEFYQSRSECYAIELRGFLAAAMLWQLWYGLDGKPGAGGLVETNMNEHLRLIHEDPAAFARLLVQSLYAEECGEIRVHGSADSLLTTAGLPLGIENILPVQTAFDALRAEISAIVLQPTSVVRTVSTAGVRDAVLSRQSLRIRAGASRLRWPPISKGPDYPLPTRDVSLLRPVY